MKDRMMADIYGGYADGLQPSFCLPGLSRSKVIKARSVHARFSNKTETQVQNIYSAPMGGNPFFLEAYEIKCPVELLTIALFSIFATPLPLEKVDSPL